MEAGRWRYACAPTGEESVAHASTEELAARFAANPSDRVAFEALEEAHFLAGRWPALVDLYSQRLLAPELGAKRQAGARSRLLLRLAQVLEERCDRIDEAVARYEEALRLDPSLRPALTQLRRIHARRDHWDLALQVAEVEGALPMRPFERAAFATEIGELWLRRLSDPAQAIASFQQAIDADPHHSPALLGLASAHEALGHAQETSVALGRAVDLLKGVERARALVRLALLVEGPLDNPRRAQELYRRAHTDDPRNLDALDALARDAEASEEWERFEDLQERRFALETDPLRKLAVAHHAGRIQLERLKSPLGARHWFRRAQELFPDDPVVHLHLADVARATGKTDELATHLRRAATLAADATPAPVLVESAKLAGAAGDHERAIADLEQAARGRGPREAVEQELASALWRAGRHNELIDLLERRIEQTPDGSAEQAALWLALAEAHEQGTQDVAAAIDALTRAAAIVPGEPRVAAGLDRLLRKSERWDELRGQLARLAASAEPAAAVALHCQRGALEIEQFQDLEAARACFEVALSLDERCPSARQGLERIALALGDDEAILDVFEREAASTTDRERLAFLVGELARIHEEQGRPEQALHWLEHLAAVTPEAVPVLERCAGLQERLGRSEALCATLEALDRHLDGTPRAAVRRRLGATRRARGELDLALAAYEGALAADPSDLESARAAVALLEDAGRPADLALARRRRAELACGSERISELHALGVLLSEQLRDRAGAVTCFEAIVDDPAAPADSEGRLLAELEALERFGALCERLERRRLRLDPLTPEAFALDLRRAELLLDRLGRPDAAISLLDLVREARPDDEVARAALERALRRTGNAARLAPLLEENAGREADPERRAALELERAGLLIEPLRALPEARALLHRLAAGGSRVAAAAEQRLHALLEQERDWPALAEALEASLARGAGDEAAERHRRLALLHRDRLRDPAAAARHLEAALALDPTRVDWIQSLALLYRQLDQPEDLLRVLELDLAQAEPERARVLHHRLADLASGRLADPARAERHWKALLALDPGSVPALEFLTRRLEEGERHAELAEVLRARLAQLGDDASAATSLRLRIAALEAGPLADPESAAATLAPAAAGEATLPVVAEPLADLYQRLGRHAELVALADRAARAAALPAERAGWHLRSADARRRAGDLAGAAEAVRQALADRPDDAAAHAVLRDLYRQLRECAPLALLLEAQVARATGSGEAPLRLELAGLYEGPLERPADALRHLRRVLEIAPGHAEALARACALADRVDDRESLADLLAEAALRAPTSSERAALLARRAALLAEKLGRRDDALACYDEALRLDPGAEATRTSLRRLLAAQGDWAGVLGNLEHSIARIGPEAGSERVARIREGAALAAAHLGADAELLWLERLRHAQPDDPEVLDRLAALHRAAGRGDALREVLDARVALARSGPERVTLQLERAELLRRQLGAPESALAALEDARALAPDDPAVLAALDELYAAQERPAAQLEVVEHRLTRADAALRPELLAKAAALARRLGRDLESARHLEALLALPGLGAIERVETLRELAGAWRRQGCIDRAVAVSEAELAGLDPEAAVFAERRRALRFELARACAEELGRVDCAIRQLGALLDVEGESGDRLEQAELLLLALLRRSDDAVELERRLAARLARRADARDADGWLELARLRRERLARPAAAGAAYREALACDPERLEALRGLRACAELLGDFEEVARSLDSELMLRPTASPNERGALLRRLGSVTWHELDHTARARAAFAAALEVDSRDLVALRSLVALAEAMEDWRGAADLLEREIEVLGRREAERRRAAWLRVAELARERIGDLPRAIRGFAAADEIAPLEPPQVAVWAECHERLGERETFAGLFGRYVDAAGAASGTSDRIRLADVLADLGRTSDALARARQASELDPKLGEAWDRVASLCEALGRTEEAAEALVCAARCTAGREAAVRRLGAAELLRRADPRRAAGWLAEAVADDAALAPAHALLAIVSAELGELAVVERAAGRALTLAAADEEALAPELRLESALAGARAASAQEHREAAVGLFEAALVLEPQHAEALASLGALRLALGDAAGARAALLRRLALRASRPDRAVQLGLLGEANERLGESATALQNYREALTLDARRESAHAGLTRLLVREGRAEEAVEALTAWAQLAADGDTRAARLLQAAELELGRPEREEAAEALLREVVTAAPRTPGAFGMLIELLWSRGRSSDVVALAPEALACAPGAPERARVALVAARALEQRGELREAAEHYRIACLENPRASEPALAAARVLRGLGEWRQAADVLTAFLAAAPADAGALTAPVQHQLGRLLAGPLESIDAGLAAYRAALEADPQLDEAREALADLLVHRPAHWEEAVARHRELLAANPLRAASLRALLRLARARGHDVGVASALALLRALGLATPDERREAATRLPISLDRKPRFTDPVWETARALVQEAAEEIGLALGVGSGVASEPRGLADPVARFRAEVTAAEAALSASALVPLSVEELAETITLVAQLTAEAEAVSGDGRIVNALAEALGRRTRRRLKRVLGETPAREIAQIDFAAWRTELRALASFAALASGSTDLRTAFLAWVAAEDPEGARVLAPDADLSARVAVIPEARALLARLVEAVTPYI
jgi:tetratricopeptide (TPR) repeat protein